MTQFVNRFSVKTNEDRTDSTSLVPQEESQNILNLYGSVHTKKTIARSWRNNYLIL
uniref:Uncharacterized protein n=1 Tax=Lepeophtheirus salmonis TaxID=72036 RepID=A0A0K2U8L3_LEPSM